MKLSITLATRGRPELLRKTLERTLPNIELADTRIVVAVDFDDADTMQIADELRVMPGVIVDIREREDCIGDKWGRAIEAAPADLYGITADYCPIVTPGFDKRIVEAAERFPDGIGVVCDYLANLSFPHIQVATAGLVRLMGGRLYPGYFPYWFVDHWLDDVSKIIGRLTFVDLIVERFPKPETQGMREPAFWASLYDSLFPERVRMALAIITSEEFDEPMWRKRMLVANIPLIEQRSRMINSLVRGMEGTDKTTDARYGRIKAAALAKLQDLAAPAA